MQTLTVTAKFANTAVEIRAHKMLPGIPTAFQICESGEWSNPMIGQELRETLVAKGATDADACHLVFDLNHDLYL